MYTEDVNKLVAELRSINSNLTKLILIEKMKAADGDNKKRLQRFLDNI